MINILNRYLNKTGISKSELARRIGIERSRMSKIVDGKTKMNPNEKLKVEAFVECLSSDLQSVLK